MTNIEGFYAHKNIKPFTWEYLLSNPDDQSHTIRLWDSSTLFQGKITVERQDEKSTYAEDCLSLFDSITRRIEKITITAKDKKRGDWIQFAFTDFRAFSSKKSFVTMLDDTPTIVRPLEGFELLAKENIWEISIPPRCRFYLRIDGLTDKE